MECPRVNLNDIFLNLPGICALGSSSGLSNSSELEESVLINSWNKLCDCALSWIGWGDSYLTSWDCWSISWLTFNLRFWDFLLPLLDQFVLSIFFNYAGHLPEPQSYSWPCLQGLLEFLYLSFSLMSLMKFLSNPTFLLIEDNACSKGDATWKYTLLVKIEIVGMRPSKYLSYILIRIVKWICDYYYISSII